ncbi:MULTISPECIES: YqiA/YcfP family alpha/beta fold hydrolase [unclassified Diaminobutyricimonas]|uniref:alpha/beta hydrolase family protein n=1 Tax=unclassified Diaminobutyricimonas TaxID=2643261 RepID=UPI0012F4BA2F|nr:MULTISPECIES: YqiA/YcfP family alpha/beta fold hydrolase [unclassified Diaminobutyricimonas]
MTTATPLPIAVDSELGDPLPDAAISYDAHEDAVIDVYLPANVDVGAELDLVIYIHGGYWRATVNRSRSRRITRTLADAGAIGMTIEYRRSGGIGQLAGGWPTTFNDVTNAIAAAKRYVEGLGHRIARTILVGHSAGGHLALWHGSRHTGIDRVIALAPVTDVYRTWSEDLGQGAAEEFLGDPREHPDAYENAAPWLPMADGAADVIVIHGTDDDIVPVAHSEDFARAVPSVRLEIAENVGHFEFIDPDSSVWELVLSEIARES